MSKVAPSQLFPTAFQETFLSLEGHPNISIIHPLLPDTWSSPIWPTLTSQVYLPNTGQRLEQAQTIYAHLTAGPLPRTLPPIPVSWSVVTAAVRPTPDEPRPVVGMARGAVHSTYRRSCDLATDGSPVMGRGSSDSWKLPCPPASAAFLAQLLTQ